MKKLWPFFVDVFFDWDFYKNIEKNTLFRENRLATGFRASKKNEVAAHCNIPYARGPRDQDAFRASSPVAPMPGHGPQRSLGASPRLATGTKSRERGDQNGEGAFQKVGGGKWSPPPSKLVPCMSKNGPLTWSKMVPTLGQKWSPPPFKIGPLLCLKIACTS